MQNLGKGLGKRTMIGKNRTDYRKVKKVEHAGYSFASKAEASLFDYLSLRQKAGEISDLKTQPSVYMTKARILYKPDFSFVENGKTVYAEMKGFETPVWRIKRRLWLSGYGPAKLQVFYPGIRNSEIQPKLREELIPIDDLEEEKTKDFAEVLK